MFLNGSAVLEPWVLAPADAVMFKGLFAGGPGPQIPPAVCDGPYGSTACIPQCSHQMKHRSCCKRSKSRKSEQGREVVFQQK